ncbi:MAG: diacylglycerol kinase family protein [Anaerolineae bacterium]
MESFRYAVAGLRYALASQRNFRIHLAAALSVVLLAFWLQVPPQSWAVLAVTVGAVLVTEMFNTAAETLVDLVSPDYHPMAKQVKDLAAGAVLIMAIVSVLVGLLVLGPPLWLRLGLG